MLLGSDAFGLVQGKLSALEDEILGETVTVSTDGCVARKAKESLDAAPEKDRGRPYCGSAHVNAQRTLKDCRDGRLRDRFGTFVVGPGSASKRPSKARGVTFR